ncbi:Allergen Asp f 4 [Ceratocystis platani]|uniref:Allergen Asp f 4 n=1 Tax=Ceratocystis fimbriata f. sp. platani TaxID=88771 RepID=A0A0F8AX99_CERFI|nr:Allergen Asp f 4 [Ceratocystis platani]
MQLPSVIAIAGALALGVAAHPSPAPGHVKAHGQFHQRRVAAAVESPLEQRGEDVQVQEFYAAGRPSKAPTTAPTASTPSITPTPTKDISYPASATTTPKPATTTKADSYNIAAAASKVVSQAVAKVSSALTPASSGTAKEFCAGSSSKKRATLADITYKGNTGSSSDWGCNIMEVDCGTISLYSYTAVVTTTDADQEYTCAHWNKIGPTGEVNGFWTSALTFTISTGEKKCFAFDTNTQGGMACSAGSAVQTTSYGQLAGTWAEYDFGSDTNSGNSGSDVSVLVAQAYSQKFIGMSISNPSGTLCSWVKSDATNFQAYMKGMEDLDGVGCTGYYKGSLSIVLGDRS